MNIARLLKSRILWTVVLAGIVVLQCANPVKDPKWQTSVELPITADKKFVLGAMLDTLFFKSIGRVENIKDDTVWVKDGLGNKTNVVDTVRKDTTVTMRLINGYPSSEFPDSVVRFAFPTADSLSDTVSEDSLGDKTFGDAFGPIPLTSAPVNSSTMPLSGAYSSGVPLTVGPLPLSIKYVYRVRFTSVTQTISVKLVNNANASFSAVEVGLGSSLGKDTITNLAPGSEQTAMFDASGKFIDSVVNVTITVTPAASGTFAAGNNIGISFSLQNLLADSVYVMDSLLAGFDRTFTNPYKLNDTVDVDFIDISKGNFLYEVSNHTGLDLQYTEVHRHMWSSDFCKIRNITTKKTLDSLTSLGEISKADSGSYYYGAIVTDRVIKAGVVNQPDKPNIGNNRLFPEWSESMDQSVTTIDYHMGVGLGGKRIRLSSADNLTFIVRTTSFKFDVMSGKTKEVFKRSSDPSVIPVTLPFPQTVKASLRTRFILERVYANLKIRLAIPEGAMIDSVKIHYIMSSMTTTSLACTSDVVLTHATRDSLFVRPVEITRVVNDFPDSVKVQLSMTIPSNTTIRVVNDLLDPKTPGYSKVMGRMIIKSKINYDPTAPLSWKIDSEAPLDFGGDTLKLDNIKGLTKPFREMKERKGRFVAEIENNSNMYLRLFAIVATDTSKVARLVDSSDHARYIKSDSLTRLIDKVNSGNARGTSDSSYVSLFDQGLLVPPRTKDSTSYVDLSDAELTKILNADVTSWRWEVRFLPQYDNGVKVTTYDALNNTDYLKMNSWIHIEGVNSVDAIMNAF